MKRLNKFFYALLAFATVGMVACSEDTTYEPGPAELENCYGVYFPEASVLESQGPMGDVSLDPSEATVFTYYAYRENTEGEITVPVEFTENTTDAEGNPMYTVDPIVFLDGEDVAEFGVTLSDKAEVGVPYTLTLAIVNDPQYVKQYESVNPTTFSLTVNRVKWIDVGQCSYTDDIITSWWGFNFGGAWAGQTHPTYDVLVQVRADSINEAAFEAALAGTGSDAGLAGIYRMVNPYRVGPWGSSDPNLTAVPNYIVINAAVHNQVYIPFQPLGMDHIIADASVMSEAYYQMTYAQEPEEVEGMWGRIENGAVVFEVDMLCGSPGDKYAGKIYTCNSDGAFKLVLSPALGVYELAMPDAEEDGDFSFSEVELPENALFYSESQAASWVPVLEKGRCEVSTKDADRIFYSQYGVIYRLPDLYEEGYPIYFAAKADGTVTLPNKYVAQATGLTQSGHAVVMAINTAESKFDPQTGLLSLVAEFYSGSGDNQVTYGSFSELIDTKAPEFPVSPAVDYKNDFSYSAYYTAPLTSDFMNSEYEATLEKGTCINPDVVVEGGAYRLPSLYVSGYDIYFVTDAEGNVGVAPGYELQLTGVNIYGKQAYMQILNGTCNEKTVVLNAKFCDAEGNALVPGVCSETIVNYVWVEIATGSYYSALYTAEDPNTGQVGYVPFTGRKLMNAEGTNLYRIENYLGEGSELNFTWDRTTNKCEITGFNDTGFDSAQFGGVGNIFACDYRTFFQWMGYDYTWEFLASALEQDVQPYYDPAANEFVFYVQLTVPEMGVGMALGEGYTEYFALDAAPSEGPKWEAVATGSYGTILSDNSGNQYVATGVVMENKENTDLYRLYDWCDNDVDVYLNFQWNQTTNKVDIIGLNDSGLPGSIFGQSSNAYICDVKTFYNELQNVNVTWEQINAQYNADLQSGYNPDTKTFTFIVCYAFLSDSGSAILNNTFFKETYVLDSNASTSAVKVSSEPIAVKNINAVAELRSISAPKTRTLNAAKGASIRKTESKVSAPVAARSLKTATPAKRDRMNFKAEL